MGGGGVGGVGGVFFVVALPRILGVENLLMSSENDPVSQSLMLRGGSWVLRCVISAGQVYEVGLILP